MSGEYIKDALKDLIARAERTGNWKAAWDILTGIRGVDDDTTEAERDELNHLTNHRIRAVTGLRPLHPNNPKKRKNSVTEKPLDKDERKKRDKLLAKAPEHFRTHYEKAANGLIALYNWDLKDEVPYNT